MKLNGHSCLAFSRKRGEKEGGGRWRQRVRLFWFVREKGNEVFISFVCIEHSCTHMCRHHLSPNDGRTHSQNPAVSTDTQLLLWNEQFNWNYKVNQMSLHERNGLSPWYVGQCYWMCKSTYIFQNEASFLYHPVTRWHWIYSSPRINKTRKKCSQGLPKMVTLRYS